MFNKNYNISRHYNPPWGIKINHPQRGMETGKSLSRFIQRGELTNCLERLEEEGFTEERALLMLAAAQLVRGAA